MNTLKRNATGNFVGVTLIQAFSVEHLRYLRHTCGTLDPWNPVPEGYLRRTQDRRVASLLHGIPRGVIGDSTSRPKLSHQIGKNHFKLFVDVRTMHEKSLQDEDGITMKVDDFMVETVLPKPERNKESTSKHKKYSARVRGFIIHGRRYSHLIYFYSLPYVLCRRCLICRWRCAMLWSIFMTLLFLDVSCATGTWSRTTLA